MVHALSIQERLLLVEKKLFYVKNDFIKVWITSGLCSCSNNLRYELDLILKHRAEAGRKDWQNNSTKITSMTFSSVVNNIIPDGC